MSLTHQSHHLVLYWHVPYDRGVLDFSDHLLEQVTQILLFFVAVLFLPQLDKEYVEPCHQKIDVGGKNVQENRHTLIYPYRCQLHVGVTLLN